MQLTLNQASPCRQQGTSLIESLIAIALFSVCILGVIGLQGSMLASSSQAQYRLQATMLASSLLGMASADPSNVGCYSVNVTPVPSCTSSAAQTAAAAWSANVLTALPSSSTTPPQVNVAADGTTSVLIRWKMPNDPSTRNFAATTQITVN